jgi:ribosomal protein L20
MPRSVNAVASRNRRKKILQKAKGYFLSRSNVYTVAKTLLKKQVFMLTLVANLRRETTVVFGLQELMRLFAKKV